MSTIPTTGAFVRAQFVLSLSVNLHLQNCSAAQRRRHFVLPCCRQTRRLSISERAGLKMAPVAYARLLVLVFH